MELQRSLPDLAGQGIVPLAVSYDAPTVLSGFAADHAIVYPLLSDEGSAVIRRYGILNTALLPGEEHYGIALPGSYLVGRDGRVEQKVFHRSHRVRESGAAVIRRVGGRAAPDSWPSASSAEGVVAVSATLEAPVFRFGQVVDLAVRLEPQPGLHLYGRPVPEGFYPTTVRVTSTSPLEVAAARYPPTEPYRVAGIDAELPAFVGEIVVVVPLVSESREGTIPLDIEVSYQACSERECYLPRTERLRLDVPTRSLVPARPRPG